METDKKRKYMYIVGPLVLLIALVGITYAFFNYTRTGVSNTIKVGKISFSSNQTDTIILTNVFPISSSEATGENTNYDEVVISITGDTTYSEGIEYLVTATNVSNTINNKQIPISIEVIPSSGLGNNDLNYFDNRGGQSSEYKVLSKDTIEENGEILVGYIAKGATGVNGTVTIKAYIDKNNIAISDTYPSGDVTHTESSGEASIEVVDYTNETTNEWVDGRVVLTTSEWNTLQNSSLSFKVRVEANEGIWVKQYAHQKVLAAIDAKKVSQTNACNPTWTDPEDGIVYFSGTNECVDMNYVWYSGKLWRITAIYPDGTMKLVTQNNITSIAYDDYDADFYMESDNESYIYKWLNEEFYPTLYNPNNIIDSGKKWNMSITNNISTKPSDNLDNQLVFANVGLINSYEYYNSYRCIGTNDGTCNGNSAADGYMNIHINWWLLNKSGSSSVWLVYSNNVFNYSPHYEYGVRPSIYLKPKLEFIGDGTITSPYYIVGDKETGVANDLINTRLSGEYIKLKKENNELVFRIIGIEDNKTKIISMDYADNGDTHIFATSNEFDNTIWSMGTTTGEDTWYTYLNMENSGYYDTIESIYGNLFDSAEYYYGTSGYDYRLSVCANINSGNTKACDKTNDKGTFKVGLPRYGEMFATVQSYGLTSLNKMQLINKYNSSYPWYVEDNGRSNQASMTYPISARPTLHLKSSVKILSGTGTEADPYVVGL